MSSGATFKEEADWRRRSAGGHDAVLPVIAPPNSAGFRLARYFTVASLAAFVLAAVPLTYVGRMAGDFFELVLREQHALFAQVQAGLARQQDESARRDLLTVHEAGMVNLTRLFANALWKKDFEPFLAKVQRIPVAHCRDIADVKDAGGRTVRTDEKLACHAQISENIMAFPEFRAIDARVFDTMKNSTVFKVKVYDLRGITVYSSEHSQIGENQADNDGWISAVAGKPASELIPRDQFNALDGLFENRNLIEIYLPVTAPGSEKIVGVFEIYSDVTPLLEQIKNTSIQIQNASAENQLQVERAVAASGAKTDRNAILLLAVVLGLLGLLYCALFLIVRNGQRIIDKQDIEREQAQAALRESEARFRSLNELSSDWYWEQNDEFRFIDASSRMRDRLGNDAHPGKTRWELPCVGVSEESWARHRADLDAHRPFRNFEYALSAGNGAPVYVSASGMPIFDERGIFKGYRGTARDITERKLVEGQRIAASAFEAHEGMLVTDHECVILRINQAFSGITGYTAEQAVGRTIDLLNSDRHGAGFFAAMRETILREGWWQGEIWNRIRNGEVHPHWLTITAVKGSDDVVTHNVCTYTDITERKQLEAARDEHEERFRNLSRRLMEVQEAERRKLSAELHDRTSPGLAAIQINLNMLDKLLSTRATEDVRALLEDTAGLLADTTLSIREISSNMRPTVLDDGGLLPALAGYAQQFMQRTGIVVQLQTEEATSALAPAVQSSLFRIVQEALTNCAKHGKARNVTIRLSTGDPVSLTIADDGVGFDFEQRSVPGLGLLTMRERAEFAGGSFSLETRPGLGTRIQVLV